MIFKFPPALASTSTSLVMKTPKTRTSVRRIYLPNTVADMLIKRKQSIEDMKDLFGDEYTDYQLVFCSTNGRPIEASVINRGFSKLIKDNNLPKVVFHSLRHSSITYKLKLNGGDMKSVQGDSGHAQLKMIEDVYSHIIDEDRCVNAQRFETEFYEQHKHKTEEAPEANAAESTAGKAEKDKETLLRLLQNPEMAKLLKTIAASL